MVDKKRRSAPRVLISDPVGCLSGVGPVRAKELAAVGISRVRDFVNLLPRSYQDRRTVDCLGAASLQVGATVMEATLQSLKTTWLGRRRSGVLVRGVLEDRGRRLPAIWFNRPFLARQFEAGDRVVVAGMIQQGRDGLQLLNADITRADSSPTGLVPIYRRTAGLGSEALRRLMTSALARLDVETVHPGLAAQEEDLDLPPLLESWRYVHAPPDDADLTSLELRSTRYHARLAFEELVELQIRLRARNQLQAAAHKAHRYRVDGSSRARVRAMLPFPLTAAQRRVTREIVDDLRASRPMSRLLQGDVGCGKTIVAAIACLLAAESGLQAAFMAPTEILARQQFEQLRRLFGAEPRTVLITSQSAERKSAIQELARDRGLVVVGTHALIEQDLHFARLGLVVVDEQHRFGVDQRAALTAKGGNPDLLLMSATPIPRSLALVLYGDLEISTIDELPPGRLPIHTTLVPASERARVFARMKSALAEGGRVFVTLPLIDENEEIAAESLEGLGREYLELAGTTGRIVSGRTPAAERQEILESFCSGRLRCLIGTTILEVGVDVPEATLMIIESADRFGLAQLHQLRGRVGRGGEQSECWALHNPCAETASERLAFFARSSDGFALAEQDLRLRGAGDLLGREQSGFGSFPLDLVLAQLPLLEPARERARLLADGLGRRQPKRRSLVAGGAEVALDQGTVS